MQRIAVPMIRGIASSTVLTLLVIPPIYSLVKAWQLRSSCAERRHAFTERSIGRTMVWVRRG